MRGHSYPCAAEGCWTTRRTRQGLVDHVRHSHPGHPVRAIVERSAVGRCAMRARWQPEALPGDVLVATHEALGDELDRRAGGNGRVWDPWLELCRRRHLSLVYANMIGGDEVIRDRGDGRRQIVLQRGMRRARKAYLLTHALVHDERRLFPPGTDPRFSAEEEGIVTAIAVARMGWIVNPTSTGAGP